MPQPTDFEDPPTQWASDTITAAEGKKALLHALDLIRDHLHRNPEHTEPIRLHIDLNFRPDPTEAPAQNQP
ncbi:hypothetical protein ACFQ0X_43715 [Streptomyces rectiviolaceus]|uniref:Uncharacterized protein n=1 Tax=Streptomyces rectiviolaceus TaxID=332591 RepID=A0ABP6NMI2_9ACTN